MRSIERIIELHRLHAKVERRMHTCMRRAITDETAENVRQYRNAYQHMITVRNIRTGANGENS